ncbi:MAG: flippase [Candidatus Altiarchaeia archaeon]
MTSKAIETIAKNAMVLYLAQVITMGLGLVLVIFTARTLGETNFGKLGFAQSFTSIFVMLTDLGLSTVAIREIARHKELTPRYLTNILAIKLILSLVTFTLIAISVNLLHYPHDTIIITYITGVSLILGSFSTFLRSIFRAFEKMEFEAALNIFKGLIATVIGLIALSMGYGLLGIVIAYLIAGVVDVTASLLIAVYKFAKPEFKLDMPFWKELIRLSLPFSGTALIGLIYSQITVVMLSIMSGDNPVGAYKAASVLVFSLIAIPDIFSFSIFPAMSRFYVSSKDSLVVTLEKSAKFLFMIGLPIALGSILLADKFIFLAYGIGFKSSIIALQILSLYLPLRFLNHATGYTLSAINKESLRAFGVTIATIANVLLSIVLIPDLGLVGASITTVLTEVILFLAYYYFTSKHFYRPRLRLIVIKPLFAGLLMCILILYFRDINIMLLVPAAAIVYFIALYQIKGIDDEDKKIIKKAIRSIQLLNVTGRPK